MKRILAALFLALVVALVGTIGVASADPPHNFTTGGGKVAVTLIPDSTRVEKFAFSAHAIGSTIGARNGHYVYEQTQTQPTVRLELEGSVDCVRVVDYRASFVGPIEKSNVPNLVGLFANFDVVDNDQLPGNGADPDSSSLRAPPQYRPAAFRCPVIPSPAATSWSTTPSRWLKV